jgi:hypothetical protein
LRQNGPTWIVPNGPQGPRVPSTIFESELYELYGKKGGELEKKRDEF